MSTPALRSEPEPREDAAPDWLEAARQAFLWRYFYDDCGRSHQGTSGLVRRSPAVEFPAGEARVSDAASHEVSRRVGSGKLAAAPLPLPRSLRPILVFIGKTVPLFMRHRSGPNGMSNVGRQAERTARRHPARFLSPINCDKAEFPRLAVLNDCATLARWQYSWRSTLCRRAPLSGSIRRRAMVSSSPKKVGRMCSCTSQQSNVQALAH
jgi:hypothetical protein